MRKAVTVGIIFVLVTMVFAAIPMKANAASVEMIRPERGKSGHVAIIHGEGLTGEQITVRFGEADAYDVKAVNPRLLKVRIPNRFALDPERVKVTVIVGGVPVGGDLWFEYRVREPYPTITHFNPELVGAPAFSVTIYGTDFTTPQGRKPSEIYFFGEGPGGGGEIEIATVTTTSFTAWCDDVETGEYQIFVGFSDDTVAISEDILTVFPV